MQRSQRRGQTPLSVDPVGAQVEQGVPPDKIAGGRFGRDRGGPLELEGFIVGTGPTLQAKPGFARGEVTRQLDFGSIGPCESLARPVGHDESRLHPSDQVSLLAHPRQQDQRGVFHKGPVHQGAFLGGLKAA
jgi:hypothetical protein